MSRDLPTVSAATSANRRRQLTPRRVLESAHLLEGSGGLLNAHKSPFNMGGNARVVLYGMGEIARTALRVGSVPGVVAVMGGEDWQGTWEGLPILTPDDLTGVDVDAIVIAATPESTSHIVPRIADTCAAAKISLYDADGHCLDGEWLHCTEPQSPSSTTSLAPLHGAISTEGDAHLYNQIVRRLNISDTGEQPTIETLFDYGWTIVGPVLYGFMRWLLERTLAKGPDLMLFGARDGFLLHQIYVDERQRRGAHELPPEHYLRISRSLAERVTLASTEDIETTLSRPYAGPPQTMLMDRFGVCSGVAPPPSISAAKNHCRAFAREILRAAATTRQLYLEHLDKLGVTRAHRLGFVDLVSAGTCQSALSSLLPASITGFYLGQYKRRGLEGLDIESMYTRPDNGDLPSPWLMQHYLLLEAVLTEPVPSVLTITEDGFVFRDEVRDADDLSRVARLQEGALAFVHEARKALGFTHPVSTDFVAEAYHLHSGLRRRVPPDLFADFLLIDDLGGGGVNLALSV